VAEGEQSLHTADRAHPARMAEAEDACRSDRRHLEAAAADLHSHHEVGREQAEEDRRKRCTAQAGLEHRSEQAEEVLAEAARASYSRRGLAERALAAQGSPCTPSGETEADEYHEEGSQIRHSEHREEGSESPSHPCSHEAGGSPCCQCDQSGEHHPDDC
jgi:hypothetical protein